uniref:7TM GPCR serpentine receptor class x (Srx) domain-containing protein n=1 Tax=Acrobeloides nanus TaxID=290746 RepID=A0A914CUF3_9BILA
MQSIYALKILIPVSGIILYIPLIYLLLRYRSRYSQAFYTLVLFMSFNDFYCLCRFTFEAVISLIEFVPDGTIYYISNLLAAFSYYMCMFLNLMIAWNRFSAVFFYTYYENFLFGTKMIIVYYVTAILISASMVVLMFYGGLWFNLEWAQV